MRTLTTAQSNAVLHKDRKVHLRVRSGSTDLSNHNSRNWVISAQWSVSADQPIGQATIRLLASDGTTFITPSRSSVLAIGGNILIDTAVLSPTATLATTDWVNVFDGVIDSISFAGDTMDIRARDRLSALMYDTWIEDERTFGDGEKLAGTVMQEIINVWEPSVTMSVPTAPNFIINEYNQQPERLLDALQAIASLFGWVVRQVWTGSAFGLQLYDPDRDKTAVDQTIGPAQYLDIDNLSQSLEGIRNIVSVVYPGGDVTVSDSASITSYGRRWMQIREANDSSIDTLAEATDFANAALSDLSEPDALQEISLRYFWPAEISDRYTFSANDVHYTTDQTWAVTGIRHEITPDRDVTVIQTRDKPTGGRRGWLRDQDDPEPPPGPQASVALSHFNTQPALQISYDENVGSIQLEVPLRTTTMMNGDSEDDPPDQDPTQRGQYGEPLVPIDDDTTATKIKSWEDLTDGGGVLYVVGDDLDDTSLQEEDYTADERRGEYRVFAFASSDRSWDDENPYVAVWSGVLQGQIAASRITWDEITSVPKDNVPADTTLPDDNWFRWRISNILHPVTAGELVYSHDALIWDPTDFDALADDATSADVALDELLGAWTPVVARDATYNRLPHISGSDLTGWTISFYLDPFGPGVDSFFLALRSGSGTVANPYVYTDQIQFFVIRPAIPPQLTNRILSSEPTEDQLTSLAGVEGRLFFLPVADE